MTIRRETKLKDLGKIEKILAKDLSTACIKAMRLAGTQVIPVLRARTVDAPPAAPEGSAFAKPGAVDTGGLLKGWEVDFSQKENTVTIYNTKNHAGPAETGVKGSSTQIGRLGRDMIEGWIMRKGIKISKPGGGYLSDKQAAGFITKVINRRKGMRFRKRAIIARALHRIRGIFTARIKEARQRLIEKAAKK